MTIALNNFLQLRVDPDTGEKRLFGKAGYQVETPKTDKYTVMNLRTIEQALDNGSLRDINGDPCTDGAVITLFCRVTKVKDAASMEQVTELTGIGGSSVAVEAVAVEAPEADQPLF
jgi:hypothetical protein